MTENTSESTHKQARNEEIALTVLEEHGIGAFNGKQVACFGCHAWMATREWQRHLAALIAERLSACSCVGYTIRTDYGTGIEHDVDRSSCPIHEGDDDA